MLEQFSRICIRRDQYSTGLDPHVIQHLPQPYVTSRIGHLITLEAGLCHMLIRRRWIAMYCTAFCSSRSSTFCTAIRPNTLCASVDSP